MKLKTLSLLAVSLFVGTSGLSAQESGAASSGTSSNGTAETAARRGPTTARLTEGRGPSSSSTRRHRRSHHRRHHHSNGMKKASNEKATPKPSSSGQ